MIHGQLLNRYHRIYPVFHRLLRNCFLSRIQMLSVVAAAVAYDVEKAWRGQFPATKLMTIQEVRIWITPGAISPACTSISETGRLQYNTVKLARKYHPWQVCSALLQLLGERGCPRSPCHSRRSDRCGMPGPWLLLAKLAKLAN